MTYAKARKDFEYLETLAPLDDWVEVDSEVLDLMRNPTKERAKGMYQSCISLWFGEARREGRPLTRRAKAIAERYYA